VEFIDSHAHLSWPEFDSIIGTVIDHAIISHVNTIINVGVFDHDFPRVLELQKKYSKNIKTIIGIHPEFSFDPPNRIERFKSQFLSHKEEFIGLGELGLDYLAIKDHAQREQMEKTFREMLQFATDVQLPIVIHCRNAEKQALKILDEFPHLKGVCLHCFGGPEKFIDHGLQNGWYFTIPTSIAFKKIHRDLAQRVPIDRIMLESDAPFLSPFPDVKVNEPCNVVEVAKTLTQIKGLPLEEIARITTKNVHQFFNF